VSNLNTSRPDKLYVDTCSFKRHEYGIILLEGSYNIGMRLNDSSTRFIDDRLHSIPEIKVMKDCRESGIVIPSSHTSLDSFINRFYSIKSDYFEKWASQPGQCSKVVDLIHDELDKTYCLASRKIDADSGIFHNPSVKDRELSYTCDGMNQYSAYFSRSEDASRLYSVVLECMVDEYSKARISQANVTNMLVWLDLMDNLGLPVVIVNYDNQEWATVEVSTAVTDPLYFHLDHDLAKETVFTLTDQMPGISAMDFHQQNRHLNNGHNPPLLN
jgi:hypothetical protein